MDLLSKSFDMSPVMDRQWGPLLGGRQTPPPVPEDAFDIEAAQWTLSDSDGDVPHDWDLSEFDAFLGIGQRDEDDSFDRAADITEEVWQPGANVGAPGLDPVVLHMRAAETAAAVAAAQHVVKRRRKSHAPPKRAHVHKAAPSSKRHKEVQPRGTAVVGEESDCVVVRVTCVRNSGDDRQEEETMVVRRRHRRVQLLSDVSGAPDAGVYYKGLQQRGPRHHQEKKSVAKEAFDHAAHEFTRDFSLAWARRSPGTVCAGISQCADKLLFANGMATVRKGDVLGFSLPLGGDSSLTLAVQVADTIAFVDYNTDDVYGSVISRPQRHMVVGGALVLVKTLMALFSGGCGLANAPALPTSHVDVLGGTEQDFAHVVRQRMRSFTPMLDALRMDSDVESRVSHIVSMFTPLRNAVNEDDEERLNGSWGLCSLPNLNKLLCEIGKRSVPNAYNLLKDRARDSVFFLEGEPQCATEVLSAFRDSLKECFSASPVLVREAMAGEWAAASIDSNTAVMLPVAASDVRKMRQGVDALRAGRLEEAEVLTSEAGLLGGDAERALLNPDTLTFVPCVVPGILPPNRRTVEAEAARADSTVHADLARPVGDPALWADGVLPLLRAMDSGRSLTQRTSQLCSATADRQIINKNVRRLRQAIKRADGKRVDGLRVKLAAAEAALGHARQKGVKTGVSRSFHMFDPEVPGAESRARMIPEESVQEESVGAAAGPAFPNIYDIHGINVEAVFRTAPYRQKMSLRTIGDDGVANPTGMSISATAHAQADRDLFALARRGEWQDGTGSTGALKHLIYMNPALRTRLADREAMTGQLLPRFNLAAHIAAVGVGEVDAALPRPYHAAQPSAADYF